MEVPLQNKKLNDLLNLIECDLDLAKSKLLKSEKLRKTLIEVKVILDYYIVENMSIKQKLQMDKIYSKAQAEYLEPESSVTYKIAKRKLDPLKNYIVTLLEEGVASVQMPDLVITNDTVIRALHDAQTLTIKNGAPRALDRYHTAFHGYLKAVCDNANISYPSNPKITQLWKALRESHPALAAKSPQNNNIDTIVRSIGGVVDAVNQTRNQDSPAHPNETLSEAEAIFVNNAVKTVLNYLNTKFK